MRTNRTTLILATAFGVLISLPCFATLAGGTPPVRRPQETQQTPAPAGSDGTASTATSASSTSQDATSQGADLGKTLLGNTNVGTYVDGVGAQGAGQLVLPGAGTVDIADIAPGATAAQRQRLEQVASDPNQLSDAGRAEYLRQSTSAGRDSEALRTIVNGRRISQSQVQAMMGDGLTAVTLKALTVAAGGQLDGVFADCKTNTQLTPVGGSATTTHEETCEAIALPPKSCTNTRQVVKLTPPVAARDQTIYSSPSFAMGPAQTFTFVVATDLRDGLGISGTTLSATPVAAGLGDVLQTALAQVPTAKNGWTGVVTTTYDDGACLRERAAHGVVCSADTVASVVVTAHVPALPATYQEALVDSPAGCSTVQAPMCTARWACTDSAPKRVNGTLIDSVLASQLSMAPLFQGQEGLCWAATATYDCSLGNQPVCWQTPTGTRCLDNDLRKADANTCRSLESRSDCTRVRQTCVEGAQLPDGSCPYYTYTYECRDSFATQDVKAQVTNNCNTTLVPNALALDQAQTPDQQGTSILEAQARLVVQQHLMSDWSSTASSGASTGGSSFSAPASKVMGRSMALAPGDGDGGAGGGGGGGGHMPLPGQDDGSGLPPGVSLPSDLQAFKGKAMECSKSLGSLLNCCTQTHSEAPKMWWDLYSQHIRQNQARSALAQSGESAGGWSQMGQGATVATLGQAFTSRSENVRGGGSGSFGDPSTGVGMSSALENMQPAFLRKAETDLKPHLGWYCSNNEFDLAVQKETGSCLYLGSYCKKKVLGMCVEKRESYICYHSPVSKDIRVYLAGGDAAVARGALGTAKHPNPSGVSMSRLKDIDFSKLPIGNIVARMAQGGATPNVVASASDMSARLTGAGSQLKDPTRQTVQGRTTERVGRMDAETGVNSIRADAQRYVPASATEGAGAVSKVSFSPARVFVRRGTAGVLTIARAGRRGSVSVVVDLVQTSGVAVGDVRFQRVRLNWSSGDETVRTVRFSTLPGVGGRLVFALSQVSGATIDPAVQATVELQ